MERFYVEICEDMKYFDLRQKKETLIKSKTIDLKHEIKGSIEIPKEKNPLQSKEWTHEKLFLEEKPKIISIKKPKLLLFAKAAAIAVIIVIIIGGALFGRAFFTGADIFNKAGTSTIDQLRRIVFSDEEKLKGEENGRVNILLLGKGGEGHDGELLTDTVMVLSVKPDTNELAMLSIPRDFWVKTEEFGYSRINKVNYYGETQKGENEGPKYAAKALEEVTGLYIPYYFGIDFEGFKDVVDSIEGVKVDVENSFNDEEYPTEDYGYQTIKFNKGSQEMDGDTALKYARSRHGVTTDGNANEASDFARARRQQKLIAAIKEKALSLGVLANPQKLNLLLEQLKKHIITNAQLWEGIRLFGFTKGHDTNAIKTFVLSDQNFLKPYRTPDGAYTLIPKEGFGKYEKIKELASNIFEDGRADELEKAATQTTVEEEKAPEKPADEALKEEEKTGYNELAEKELLTKQKEEQEKLATVAIQNGTTINGLAKKTSDTLKNYGYSVSSVGNASDQTKTQTVIYDNTSGKKSKQLNEIAAKIGAKIISGQSPKNKSGVRENADFVVVLGTDQNR